MRTPKLLRAWFMFIASTFFVSVFFFAIFGGLTCSAALMKIASLLTFILMVPVSFCIFRWVANVYIIKYLTEGTKNCQQNGTLNNPQRGSFKEGKL